MSYIVESERAAEELSGFIQEFGRRVGNDFRIQFDRRPFCIEYWLRIDGIDVSHFKLVQQINCCGICVSTDTWVNDTWKNKGIGKEMLLLKEAIAKRYGFSLLFATVNVTGNPAEEHILLSHGWEKTTVFNNSRTKNNVGMFVKKL